MESELKRWVMYQANAELDHDPALSRNDVIRSVLTQFLRQGDAERYMRRDGHVAWRATRKFKEWIAEGERELDEER